MRIRRASLLLDLGLILVAAAAHQAGAGEFAFLLATVVLCVVVWRRSGRGSPFLLNDAVATIVCLAAFIGLMWRGIATGAAAGFRMADVGVGSVGDFLIVYEWVALCRRRAGHDDFWMYLVTLVLMGTAGLQLPGLAYGFFFILYTFLVICALAAHLMARESFLAEKSVFAGPIAAAAPPRLTRRFFLAVLLAMLPVLAGVAGLFVLLPRTGATGALAPIILRLGQQPVSGFTNTVRLGEVGQIQDNPARVMHVSLRDPATHESVRMESLNLDSLLLRGLPLDLYSLDHGAWTWRNSSRSRAGWRLFAAYEAPGLGALYLRTFPGFSTAPYRSVTCDITLEPLSTRILFVPFAPERLNASKAFSFAGNIWTYELVNTAIMRRTPIDYSVTSRIFDPAPPPAPLTLSGALAPLLNAVRGRGAAEEDLSLCLTLPGELSPRIHSLARHIVPPSARSDYEKAQRILGYLSDSARFSYTTLMRPTPGVEPVEDFLFNLRRGHCEYFASSMVILLREVGVPARVVNGFKVSEWNPITSAYIVRQQHAHSWVEAYLRPYGWRTFDPSVARDAASPQPMLARRIGNNVYDWAETLWVSYVLNFDSTNQKGLYRALDAVTQLISRYTLGPLERLTGQGAWISYEPPEVFGGFYRVLMAVVWIAAIFLAGVVVWTGARGLCTRLRRESAFYPRMEQLLAQRGRRRAGGETPWEFSARLEKAGWPAQAEVAAITECFCRARYGGRALTEADLRRVQSALKAIRRAREI